MKSAKLELIGVLEKINKTCAEVKAYNISHDVDWNYNPSAIIKGEGHITQQELDKLDFNYDNGYGGQMLFGTILFDDGSWLERGEYDGSEWWEYKKTPSIEEILKDE